MFGFIASKLKQFVEREEGLKEGSNKTRTLGFTFSFPTRQNSVSSGVLIKWTKGFSIEDAVSYISLDLLPWYLC
jgi:hexokinase